MSLSKSIGVKAAGEIVIFFLILLLYISVYIGQSQVRSNVRFIQITWLKNTWDYSFSM